mmetsp:Transcript_4463/g.10260  ORF Transcript_4463/g.10260 Transcript_4463/m.10260 type:complete len:322 (+) Transcript_4463:64-1029(+)
MAGLIRWAHAANGLAELDDALRRGVEAVEADVGWNGRLGAAVMRHARDSQAAPEAECSAAQWLRAALAAHRGAGDRGGAQDGAIVGGLRILKLDFKHLPCAAAVLDDLLLAAREGSDSRSAASGSLGSAARRQGEPGASGAPDELQIADSRDTRAFSRPLEVWLNADVIHVGGSSHPDTPAFLDACGKFVAANPPFIVRYSLGWVTNDYAPWRRSSYTCAELHAMRELCKQATLPKQVTFAVRASYAAASLSDIHEHLLQPLSQANTGLTLWTGWEGVPTAELEHCRKRAEMLGFELHLDVDRGSKAPWYHPSRYLSKLFG